MGDAVEPEEGQCRVVKGGAVEFVWVIGIDSGIVECAKLYGVDGLVGVHRAILEGGQTERGGDKYGEGE